MVVHNLCVFISSPSRCTCTMGPVSLCLRTTGMLSTNVSGDARRVGGVFQPNSVVSKSSPRDWRIATGLPNFSKRMRFRPSEIKQKKSDQLQWQSLALGNINGSAVCFDPKRLGSHIQLMRTLPRVCRPCSKRDHEQKCSLHLTFQISFLYRITVVPRVPDPEKVKVTTCDLL